VRDSASGLLLIDVDIVATPPDRQLMTDPVGRFKLGNVPANVPLTIQAGELGYLPRTVTLEADQDTSIEMLLVPDRLAEVMIARVKQNLAERSAPRANPGVPVIDRAELIRNINRSVLDVLTDMLRNRTGRISCVVLDEERLPLGVTRLTMMPDRIEHIEVIQYGFRRQALMVRLYSRDYFVDLMAGKGELVAQDKLVAAARRAECL
jgi:hypothetical protein